MESTLLSKNAILDSYWINHFLGSGWFAEVWLCRYEAMGDLLALEDATISSWDAQRVAEKISAKLKESKNNVKQSNESKNDRQQI